MKNILKKNNNYILSKFNNIRNNQSLVHDNKESLKEECYIIFDQIFDILHEIEINPKFAKNRGIV
jgi:hypothetical protein